LLPLNISSPKRDRKSLSGWEGFFPYYAGYPKQFALDAILSAGLAPRSCILDPWNGSGTTIHAASQLGHTAIGFDINPVMVVVARARMLASSEADSLVPLGKEIIRSARVRQLRENEPLNTWFAEKTAAYLRAIESSIQRCLVGTTTQPNLSHLSSIAAVFYSALFSVCRDLAIEFRCSNPTWIRTLRAGEKRVSADVAKIAALFADKIESMSSSLVQEIISGSTESSMTACRVGDSTELSLQKQSIDLVLGSPPYCTRIDYVAATRIELAVLAGLVGVNPLTLGHKMIGTTKVPVIPPAIKEQWGSSCLTFLDSVSKHYSKASSGYYFKTHLDYYDKIFRSLEILSTALRPKGKAIFVVQDSYYKEIHNPLSEIFSEMAQTQGLALKYTHDFSVRRSMGSVNIRSRKYRANNCPTESVLCFEK
jgi:DNA methylase